MDRSKLEVGTVIHGTLRPQDVAPAYLHALEHYAPYYIGTDWFTEIADEVQRIVDLDGEVENAHDIIVRLEDEINSLLPDGYRFGPHEGDPADIGLWYESEDGLMSDVENFYDGPLPLPGGWAEEHEGEEWVIRFVADLGDIIFASGLEGMNELADAALGATLTDLDYVVIRNNRTPDGRELDDRHLIIQVTGIVAGF